MKTSRNFYSEEQAILYDIWDRLRGEPEPGAEETTWEERLKEYLIEKNLIDVDGEPLPEPETKFMNVDPSGARLIWEPGRSVLLGEKESSLIGHLLVLFNMAAQMAVISLTNGKHEEAYALGLYLDRWLRAEESEA